MNRCLVSVNIILMIAVFIFIYGLIIGSFLNVCAFRIPKEQSIVYPNSYCPNCGVSIKPYDNIPIISYILLKGKCRNCKKAISLRYPAVELLSGLLFLATYFSVGISWLLLPSLVFVSLLFLVLLIDLDHQIIPNGLVVFGLAAASLFLIASIFFGDFPLIKSSLNMFISSIGGGLLAFAALLFIAYFAKIILRKEAMGGGDIKLAAVMGMFLGPYVFLSLFLAFLMGSLVSVFLLWSGVFEKGKPVPFGPFMSAGGILTLYFGFQIWQWYLRFI